MNRIGNITSNLSVRLIRAYHIRHSADWHEHKTRSNYALWCVTGGCLAIEINGERYSAKEGDAVLFCPGITFTAYADNCECSFIFVFFKLELGGGADSLEDLQLSGVISGDKIHKSSEVFRKKFNGLQTSGKNISLRFYSDFLSYVCDITELINTASAQRFKSERVFTAAPDMHKVTDYIIKNYYKNIKIKELAAIANLSEKRFISNFRDIIGIAPGQYITQCRMNRAAQLLKATDMKIFEIAAQLGYADQYSFSKAFKRSFGESPAVFRRNVII